MNTRSFCFGGLLLATLVSAAAATGFSAEPAGTVYNRKSGLIAGWSSTVWGNLNVEPSKAVIKEAGGLSLLVTPTAVASPYAGLQIACDGPGGIALTPALRKNGAVYLYLRNGTDVSGKPAASQVLQVMLSFQPDGGKAVNGAYEQVVLDQAPADEKAPAVWQLVKISIPTQMQGRVDPATPVKLRGVYVQYVDQPMAGYFVGECTVTSGSAK